MQLSNCNNTYNQSFLIAQFVTNNLAVQYYPESKKILKYQFQKIIVLKHQAYTEVITIFSHLNICSNMNIGDERCLEATQMDKRCLAWITKGIFESKNEVL